MDTATIIMTVVVGGLVLVSLIFMGISALMVPKAFNSGTSLGVNSVLSNSSELLMSLFVVYFPISFIWLGGFLIILTGNFSFAWPSLGAVVACTLLMVVSKIY